MLQPGNYRSREANSRRRSPENRALIVPAGVRDLRGDDGPEDGLPRSGPRREAAVEQSSRLRKCARSTSRRLALKRGSQLIRRFGAPFFNRARGAGFQLAMTYLNGDRLRNTNRRLPHRRQGWPGVEVAAERARREAAGDSDCQNRRLVENLGAPGPRSARPWWIPPFFNGLPAAARRLTFAANPTATIAETPGAGSRAVARRQNNSL